MNAIIRNLIVCFGYFVLPAAILVFSASCRQKSGHEIALSDTLPVPQFKRLDQAVFSKTRHEHMDMKQLRSEYGRFFDIYCFRILRLPQMNDTSLALAFRDFVNNDDIRQIKAAVDSQYRDISPLEEEVSGGFRHYAHYFPERHIPQIVTYVSGLELSIACADSVLGIGLDLYLGQDYRFYRAIMLPAYKTRRMTRPHIAYDAMKGWLQTEFIPVKPQNNLLSQMIYNGKLLYLLDVMFPEGEDSLKIGYTASQLEFCRKNEARIWTHLIEQKLLFETDFQKYGKFISDGPTTNGFPRESPSMTGTWTGWQIIRKYMKENPNRTLQQLMAEEDEAKILKESKYKPSN